MGDSPGRLAIVAGGGALPDLLIAACRERGLPTLVVGLEGQADPAWCASAAVGTVRLGEPEKLMQLLRAGEADSIVFAGKIQRPALREIRPDWRAARVLAGLLLRGRLGDEAITGAVVRSFERAGFRVLAPRDILGGPAAAGPLGRVKPTPEQERDIAHGARAAREIGRLDIGHAVVVQDGAIVAVEGAEGTDALIRRCADLPRGARGGILVKVAKPQQDPRADPPTIGSDTVAEASAVGFAGIAFDAEGTLVADLPAAIRGADAAGLFLVGLEPGA
jgi:DUF1009 family protein